MKGKYKVLTALFILISISISSAYLFLPDSFQSLDNRVRDFYFKFRGPESTSNDIVIVDIDEKSLQELGQWPWERDKFARVLQNLTNSGVGIIGVDIIFSEADKTSPKRLAKEWGVDSHSLPDYDTILAQTISNTPTILGYLFNFDLNNSNEAPDIPAIFIQKHIVSQEFLPQAKGVLSNLDILQKATYSSGYINNIPDESGMIRSIPLLIKYDMEIYPSLAFEMYRIAKNVNKVIVKYSEIGIDNIMLGKENINCDRFGRLYLNFRGESKSYKYISAVDIYNNNINRSHLEGKFVLIGTSAYGLMDLRSTPMDSVIAGVELHANAIDNLLQKDMLYKPSWVEFVDLLVIVFSAFIVIFIYSRFSLLSLMLVHQASVLGLIFLNYDILFNQYIVLNSIFPLFSMTLSLVGVLGINYMFESRQKDFIKGSFSKKVSKQVMDDLLANPDDKHLSSREVVATIYFSDIRSFTSISETLKSPKRITDFLNYYMNIMVQSVEKNSGTIDKFIGDSIMAYWNAPLEIKNHPDKAIVTALEQIEMRDELNKSIKKEFGFDVDYGIGINTGAAVVGEIGSEGRSDYTIIGDAVNLASRLEGLCKVYKVRLVISEFTKELLSEEYVIQLLDIVQVKGKQEPVKIYEVQSRGKPTLEKEEELTMYTQAHQLYMDANFIEAQNAFDTLFGKYQKYLYKLYRDRCEYLSRKEIENFDGIFKFETK